MYLTDSNISNDAMMQRRVSACAAQEGCAQAGIDPSEWTLQWRLVWAAAPGWGEAWESAEASGNESPGSDPAVITDSEILSQVQAMKPFATIGTAQA